MLWWQVQWTWKYRIKRQPYDEAAQIYLTRDFLRMSSTAWDALEAPEKQEMLDKELWIEEKQKVSIQDNLILRGSTAGPGGVLALHVLCL